MVMGQNLEEQKQDIENRLCPCIPAIESEIPKNGNCHCGIFCTSEKANQLSQENHFESLVCRKRRFNKR